MLNLQTASVTLGYEWIAYLLRHQEGDSPDSVFVQHHFLSGDKKTAQKHTLRRVTLCVGVLLELLGVRVGAETEDRRSRTHFRLSEVAEGRHQGVVLLGVG